MREPKYFCYKNIPYPFTYEKAERKASGILYIGQFENTAPGGLQPGVKYCLKEIPPIDPSKMPYPVHRECYDLLDFKGDHLRKVLLRSDSAEETARELKNSNGLKSCAGGMIIEPRYESAETYFTECHRFPVATRLDIALQYALGSDELSREVNRISRRSIMAHRDLKWENGMVEMCENQVRIRLIDFATVWLEGTTKTGTMVVSGTQKTVFSPENTSPESVIDEYAVSEKTDVYALGMLLASMFTRCEGSYVNPNEVWVREIGWYQHNDKALNEALQYCLKEYEQSPVEARSWIERDLEQRGKSLQWEMLSDKKLLNHIRELFCKATRIDPDKRISRSDFIRELTDIINTASQKESRQPVSVYLFNTANTPSQIVLYRNAVGKAFLQDAKKATSHSEPVPHALCVSYGGPTDDGKIDTNLKLMSRFPCCTVQEIQDSLSTLKPDQQASQDHLLYGIYKASSFLYANRDRYRFTGQVYLFTPSIPTEEELIQFRTAYKTYDLNDLSTETLDKLCGKQTEFYAFSVTTPRDEVWDWCDCEQIQAEPPKKQAPKSAPEPPPGVAFFGKYKFNISPTAPYITLPGGNQVYIGIMDD